MLGLIFPKELKQKKKKNVREIKENKSFSFKKSKFKGYLLKCTTPKVLNFY